MILLTHVQGFVTDCLYAPETLYLLFIVIFILHLLQIFVTEVCYNIQNRLHVLHFH